MNMAETCDDPIDLEHLTNELEKFDKMLKESDDSDSAAESGMDSSNIDLSSGTPTYLEKYLLSVAKTGNPLVPWKAVKTYIRHKIDSILTNFYEKYGIEDIYSQNLPLFNYIPAKEKLLQHFDTFTGAPFTIQRLCELLLEPGRHYKRTDRLLRAFEKNILVVSTTGRLSDDCSDPQQRSLLFNSLQMTTFRAFRPPLPDHGDKYSEKRWKWQKSIHCWSPEVEEKSLDYLNMDEEKAMWEMKPLVYSASSVHSSITEKSHLDCSISGGNSPKRDQLSLEYISNFDSSKIRKKRKCKYSSSGGNSLTREMLPLEYSATPDDSSVRGNLPVIYSATIGKSKIRRKRPLEYSSTGVDSPWPKAYKRHKRCHSNNTVKFIIPQASADDVELKAGTAGGSVRGGLIGGQHLNGDDSGMLEEDEASFEDECLKHDHEDDDMDEEELEDELRPRFAGAGGGGGLDSYSLAVSSVLSIRRKRKEQHHKQHQQRSKRMRLEKQQQQQQQRDAVKERKHHEGEDEDDEGEEEEEDEDEEEEQGGSKTAAIGTPLQQEACSRLLTTAKTSGKQTRRSDRDEVKSPLDETSSDEETMPVDTPAGTVAAESKSSEETESAQTVPKDDSADDDSDVDSTELKKKELDVQKTEEAPAEPKVTEEDNAMETEESVAEAVVEVDTKPLGDGPPASELSPMSENQTSASETSAADKNEATESADECSAGESGVSSTSGDNVEEASPKREQPEEGEPQVQNGVAGSESDDSEGVAPVEAGQASGEDRAADDRGCSKRDGGTEQLG